MFLNCVYMALRELRANLLRTSLTMLGMIIGVSSVVIVVTVMQGVSRQVISDISTMNRNLIFVSPARVRGVSQRVPLKLADATAIAQSVQGVLNVAPLAASGLVFSANGREKEFEIDGTTNDFFATRGATFALGRPFFESELRGGTSVCVLGQGARKEFFGLQNPMGAVMRSGSFYCRIVGVLAKQATSMITSDADDMIVVPINTYHRRLAGNTHVDALFIQAARDDLVTDVKNHVTAIMRVRRGSVEGRPDNFRVEDIHEAMQTINSVAFQLALAIAGVAAISLVVGAILGLAAAAFIAGLIGTPVSVSAEVLALAFVVPVAIGIAFGFFPALRASRLDPIEALRFE